MSKKNYWAFISYSSKDNRTGSWLHKRLENYPIPSDFRGQEMFDGAVLGKNLRPVFRDRDELSGSSNLGEAIGEALEASRFLIVLCSKNSAKSEWVNKEIESFNEMGKGDNILALILDGEPNATSKGRPEDECFPPALQYPAEPIAGDLRKEGDGKERGFLKVLAGITQLDFDQLYRRHERNMAHRRRMIALAAGLLTTIFAGLAGYAFYQQRAAVKAQILAEENEKLAIKNELIAKEKEKLAKDNEQIALAAKKDAEDARDEATAAQLLAEKNEKLAIKNEQEANKQRLIAEEKEQEVSAKLGEVFYQSATHNLRLGNFSETAKDLINAKELGVDLSNLETAASFMSSSCQGLIWDSGNVGADIRSLKSDPDNGMITIVLGNGTIQRWDIINRKIKLEYQFIDIDKTYSSLDKQIRDGMFSDKGDKVVSIDKILSTFGNTSIRNLDDSKMKPLVPVFNGEPFDYSLVSLDTLDLPVIISEVNGGMIGQIDIETGDVINVINDERFREVMFNTAPAIVSGNNWSLLGSQNSIGHDGFFIKWDENPEITVLEDCKWIGRVGENPVWVDGEHNIHLDFLVENPLPPPTSGGTYWFVDMDSNTAGDFGAIAYKSLSIGGEVVILTKDEKFNVTLGFPPEEVVVQGDGKWIAVRGMNRLAIIKDGEVISVWTPHQPLISFIGEGPDDSLITVGSDNRIRLWNTDRINSSISYPIEHDYYDKGSSKENLPLLFTNREGLLVSATYNYKEQELIVRTFNNGKPDLYYIYKLPVDYANWGFTKYGEIVLGLHELYFDKSREDFKLIFTPGRDGYEPYYEEIELTAIHPMTSVDFTTVSKTEIINPAGVTVKGTDDYKIEITDPDGKERIIDINSFRESHASEISGIYNSRYSKSANYGTSLYSGITDLAWGDSKYVLWFILKESNGAEYLGALDLKYENLLYFQRMWDGGDSFFIRSDSDKAEAVASKEEILQFISLPHVQWDSIADLTNTVQVVDEPEQVVNPWESSYQLTGLLEYYMDSIPENLREMANNALELDPTSVQAGLALAWADMVENKSTAVNYVPELKASHPWYSRCQVVGEFFSLIFGMKSEKWIDRSDTVDDDLYTRKLRAFVEVIKDPNKLPILIEDAIESDDNDMKWFLQGIGNSNNPQELLFELYKATFSWRM